MATVLFVSECDTGSSQMASALFERAADGRHKALSAGTRPGDRVEPLVVDAMCALGIDLRDRQPRELTEDLVGQAHAVVLMGDVDDCPYIPGRLYMDWDLDEPELPPREDVREVRDDIGWRADALVVELDWWVATATSESLGGARRRPRHLATRRDVDQSRTIARDTRRRTGS